MGMCFIVDHSGKVGRNPTIKDIIVNENDAWFDVFMLATFHYAFLLGK